MKMKRGVTFFTTGQPNRLNLPRISLTHTENTGFIPNTFSIKPVHVFYLNFDGYEARLTDSYAWPTRSTNSQPGMERYSLPDGRSVGKKEIETLCNEARVYALIQQGFWKESQVKGEAKLKYMMEKSQTRRIILRLSKMGVMHYSPDGEGDVDLKIPKERVPFGELSWDRNRREKDIERCFALARKGKLVNL